MYRENYPNARFHIRFGPPSLFERVRFKMRDIEFSLADIIRILAVYDDREQLEQFFSARQKGQEAISQDTAHKLMLLDTARKRLRKKEDMRYNVTLKTIPERYAATVQMTIPRYEDEGMIWGKLTEETCRMNLVEDDPCLCAVTYEGIVE